MYRVATKTERGGSKLNLLMTLAILGAMALAAIRIGPVYFANYQIQDAMNSESRFALTGYPKRNADDVRSEVYAKAQNLGIPAKPEDIQVTMENGYVSISMDYSVPIDLIFWQWTPQFHPHADNRSI